MTSCNREPNKDPYLLVSSSGRVVVRHIPGVTNPADLFTKILDRQTFEKHRKSVLNLPGDTGIEHARRVRVAARDASSQRDGTSAV